MTRLVATVLFAVFVAGFSFKAQAQLQNCTIPSIDDCPSMYVERCKSDDAFRNEGENVFKCFDAISGKTEDQAYCSTVNVEDCKVIDCNDPTLHPLEAFYCRKGAPNCPVNIGELQNGFDKVLLNLDETLKPYGDLIELDPEKLGDVEELCEYKTTEVKDLQQQATQDNSGLDDKTRELAALVQCNGLVNEFMESEPPEGVSAALWANIKNLFDAQIEKVNQRSGAIKSKMESLQSAPGKIAALKFVHDIACPQLPDNENSSTNN